MAPLSPPIILGCSKILKSCVCVQKIECAFAQSEDDLRFNGGSSVLLSGLSVGGMVWQRLSFATAASDMVTKRDQTQTSHIGVEDLLLLGVCLFVVVQGRWLLEAKLNKHYAGIGYKIFICIRASGEKKIPPISAKWQPIDLTGPISALVTFKFHKW